MWLKPRAKNTIARLHNTQLPVGICAQWAIAKAPATDMPENKQTEANSENPRKTIAPVTDLNSRS